MLSRLLQTGTSVAVYGTVGLDSPTSAYLLDGGSPSLYAPGKSNTMVYQHLFYQSPTLANGEHTLLITDAGSGMLWIDYLSYTPSVPPQSVSSLASSSHSPSTILPLSSAFTSRVVTPTPSQQPVIDTPTPKPPSTSSNASPGTGPPDQVNSTSKSSIPGPAVAGGAIGALILIITLIFGMLYYRRRAKRLAGAKLLEKKDAFSGKMTAQCLPKQTSYVSRRFLRVRQDQPQCSNHALYKYIYFQSPHPIWLREPQYEHVPTRFPIPAIRLRLSEQKPAINTDIPLLSTLCSPARL